MSRDAFVWCILWYDYHTNVEPVHDLIHINKQTKKAVEQDSNIFFAWINAHAWLKW